MKTKNILIIALVITVGIGAYFIFRKVSLREAEDKAVTKETKEKRNFQFSK